MIPAIELNFVTPLLPRAKEMWDEAMKEKIRTLNPNN